MRFDLTDLRLFLHVVEAESITQSCCLLSPWPSFQAVNPHFEVLQCHTRRRDYQRHSHGRQSGDCL